MLRLAKEPFIHFLLLGCLIFAAYSWTNRDQGQDEQIVINQQELDHLRKLWSIQWKREPNTSETRALLERYVRQEVFYREALRMNLDRNDEIIRKRLSQKMEAVANDLGALMRPAGDEELRAFFGQHPELFRLRPSYAFRQVLLRPDEARDQAQLATLLAQLQGGEALPASRRDRLAVPNDWPPTLVPELENAFGGDFAKALADAPLRQWSGPLRSGYGWHLVYVESRQAPALPDFEAVREYVAQEYDYQAEREIQDRVYQELLTRYRVIITAADLPDEAKASFAVQR